MGNGASVDREVQKATASHPETLDQNTFQTDRSKEGETVGTNGIGGA